MRSSLETRFMQTMAVRGDAICASQLFLCAAGRGFVEGIRRLAIALKGRAGGDLSDCSGWSECVYKESFQVSSLRILGKGLSSDGL